MTLSKQKLFALKVVTVRGFPIGTVVDISFDTENQSVAQYHVRSTWTQLKLTPLPSRANYLISREQVIRITDTELIVQDGVISAIEEHERKYLEGKNRFDGKVQAEPTLSQKE